MIWGRRRLKRARTHVHGEESECAGPSTVAWSAARWDAVIGGWLDGGSSTPDELHAWAHAYRGQGEAAPVHDALPEPFFGNRRDPAMVFLALNPGQAFLGTQSWHQAQPLPDLQSRRGVFAEEIRAAGAYGAWASRFPDWSRWVASGNPFYSARFRFARDWSGGEGLVGDQCLLLELYPWHSRRFDPAAFRPGPEALEQVSAHILDPLAAFSSTPVFAFGSPWFAVLPLLGFEEVKRWSVGDGHRLGRVKDRTVSLFQRGSLRVVGEKHAGGAGPPKQEDVPVLRELLDKHLG